jgi:hypothetical protein
MLLALVAVPATLSAHESLFGPSPRTIWKNGAEFEAEFEWEMYKRFFERDKPVSNPRRTEVHVMTFTVAFTYGFTRDFSIRVMTPFARAERRSKDGRDHYMGLKDFSVAARYRLYHDAVPGGSFQGAVFAEVMLPTAQSRSSHGDASHTPGLLAEKISFGEEAWGFSGGISWAYSTLRHYFWLDVVAGMDVPNERMTMGPWLQIHPVYATRLFELTDYTDFDLILLFEADFMITERMYENRRPVTRSGNYKIHLGAGLQFNITNRVEIKFGYEYPVYQYYYRRTFVHEGEAKFMFNYLF